MARAGGRVNVPLLAASVGAALLIVVLAVGWLPRAPPPARAGGDLPPVEFPSPTSGSTAVEVTIAPAGMEIDLSAHGFQAVMFALALPGVVSGSYESTEAVGAFILTPSAYSDFVTTGTPETPLWSSDGGPGGAVDLDAQAGTWYLLFSAVDLASPAAIHVTSTISAVLAAP